MSKRKKIETVDVEDLVLSVIRRRRPDNVQELILLVQKEVMITEDEVYKTLHKLEDQKRINYVEPLFPITFRDYLFSFRSIWYWLVVAISIVCVITILLLTEDTYPLTYLRNAFGVIFVIFMPGYSLIKALYPITVPLPTRSIAIDSIERIALSLGMSLAIVPLLGLLLYYTPLGLNFLPTTFGILIITLASATYAISSEYKSRKALRKYRKTMAYFKS